MISGLIKVSGALTLRIIYGKDYECKDLGYMLLWSCLNAFWLLSFIFILMAEDIWGYLGMGAVIIGYPILIWFLKKKNSKR